MKSVLYSLLLLFAGLLFSPVFAQSTSQPSDYQNPNLSPKEAVGMQLIFFRDAYQAPERLRMTIAEDASHKLALDFFDSDVKSFRSKDTVDQMGNLIVTQVSKLLKNGSDATKVKMLGLLNSALRNELKLTLQNEKQRPVDPYYTESQNRWHSYIIGYSSVLAFGYIGWPSLKFGYRKFLNPIFKRIKKKRGMGENTSTEECTADLATLAKGAEVEEQSSEEADESSKGFGSKLKSGVKAVGKFSLIYGGSEQRWDLQFSILQRTAMTGRRKNEC